MLYRVLDVGPFRAWVERVGGQAAASRKIRVAQSHVSRILSGQVKRIGAELYGKILSDHRGADARAALLRAVLTPWQEAHWRQYRQWLWDQIREAATRPHPKEESVGTAVKQLRDDRRYAEYFTPLENAVKASWSKEEREARLAVAEYRILAPLVRGHISGGVERTLADLDVTGELGSYLRAMVQAECLLLRRASDYDRVQEGFPARPRKGERWGVHAQR